MQGPFFLVFIRDFNDYVIANSLQDDKPHALILDGYD